MFCFYIEWIEVIHFSKDPYRLSDSASFQCVVKDVTVLCCLLMSIYALEPR